MPFLSASFKTPQSNNPFVIPQPFCLSFHSPFVCHSAAFLFVIPQRSGGICCCPFVCHSAAKRRNLLFYRRILRYPHQNAAARIPLLRLHPRQPLPHSLRRIHQRHPPPHQTAPRKTPRLPHRKIQHWPPRLLRTLHLRPKRNRTRKRTKRLEPPQENSPDRTRQSNMGRPRSRMVVAFCLSFRSAAEESASAVAVAIVLVFAVALLFVIPQRSGGICFCRCSCSCSCFRSCPFVCHSAAQRRNLLLQLQLQLQLFLSLQLPFCLSFRSAAEESASAVAVAVVLVFAVALLFVIPQRSGGICFCNFDTIAT